MIATQKHKLVKILDWQKMDVERKLGFKGGKYTDVNALFAFLLGAVLCLLSYGVIYWLQERPWADIFWKRGVTPYFIVFFAWWSVAILYLKWRKLLLQEKALHLMVVPRQKDFELTTKTARDILSRMDGLVDDPKHFVLLNRIERALSNLNNIGMIADVSEMLRAQAQNDEDHMESSYSLVRGFIWAIPVLGFIGTVLGLSQAIGRFGGVLRYDAALAGLKDALKEVTAGLSVAFDTTLIALVAALAIQLFLTALKRREEAFLDDCKDYCHAHIISKLRLVRGKADMAAVEVPAP